MADQIIVIFLMGLSSVFFKWGPFPMYRKYYVQNLLVRCWTVGKKTRKRTRKQLEINKSFPLTLKGFLLDSCSTISQPNMVNHDKLNIWFKYRTFPIFSRDYRSPRYNYHVVIILPINTPWKWRGYFKKWNNDLRQ